MNAPAQAPAPQRPARAPPQTLRFFTAAAPSHEKKKINEETRSPLLFKQTLSWLQLEVLEEWNSSKSEARAVIDRLAHPHSNALYREMSDVVHKCYRQLLKPTHPFTKSAIDEMKKFKAVRQAGGLSRTELCQAFCEQRLSKQWEEVLVQRIVTVAQQNRNTETPINQIAEDMLVQVLSAWGASQEISKAVAEEMVANLRIEQSTTLIGKTGLTGWVKYMLPFWSCCVLAVCVTLYSFLKQVYMEWCENWFHYNETILFNHINPDYYGRLCKSTFGSLMYDKINWNETRFLLEFIFTTRNPAKELESVKTNTYKRAFIQRFRSDENDYNKSPILSVDPLSPIGVELAVKVLCKCDFKTLVYASAVCRTWRYWCSNDYVWREATKNVESFLPFLGGALSLFQALHYRLPSTAKGRALYYAKHLQTRPSIKFQEKLLNLVDADFIAAVKERQEAAQTAAEAQAANEGKRKSRASVFFQSTRALGGRLVENVQSMLAAEPIIIAMPFDLHYREHNVSLQFSSQSFGVIDVDVLERVVPAQGGAAEDVVIASGQVHLPYLIHSLQLWKETCPMWGEKGGPQVYVDAFLRWIERKFWASWWPRPSKPVGISLNDFIDLTWGLREVPQEMDTSGWSSTGAALETELGMDIAPLECQVRGVLLSRNALFLAVELSTEATHTTPPTTSMRTGGDGAELVWLARLCDRVGSIFEFRSAATGHYLSAKKDGGHMLTLTAGKECMWRRERPTSNKHPYASGAQDVEIESRLHDRFRWRSLTTGRTLLEPPLSRKEPVGQQQPIDLWTTIYVEPRSMKS